MAYEIGTATDYRDLLDKLIRFLTSRGTIGAPVYTGTGNGQLLDFETQPEAPTETWTLACSNATKVGAANYGTTVAAQTPVLHWRFNETVGTNADDATANNHDGTISGSVTLGSAGLLSVDTNKAFTFGGGKVVSGAIAVVQITGDGALECIINPSSISGTQFIAGIGAPGTGNANNYLMSLWMVEGYLKIYHEYGSGNVQQVITSYKLAAGRTYHLVLSRDNVNKKYQLIVGGIVRHEFAYVFPASDGTNAYFAVGCDPDGLYPFSGVIDEPALYNAQISAATAAAHAQAALGHETFTVTGSVSGAQTNATVGVPYANSFIEFLITDGSTDFVVTDQWSIGVTSGGLGAQAWAVNRREQDKVFLQGPGLSGADEIYVSIKTYFDAGVGYYNWEIRGADGYDATTDEAGQPNVCPAKYMPAWNAPISYLFRASGRFFIVIAKISTTYHGCYAGLVLPIATPTQYPYPIAIGGSARYSTNRYSVADDSNAMFFSPCINGLCLRDVSGAWREFYNNRVNVVTTDDDIVWPYRSRSLQPSAFVWAKIRNDVNDVVCPVPVKLLSLGSVGDTTFRGDLAVLDGCLAVVGFGNASENLVDIDGTDYYVVQNVFRTTNYDFFAVELA